MTSHCNRDMSSIVAHVWSQYAISVLSLSLSSKHGNPVVELQNENSMGTGATSDQISGSVMSDPL